MIQAIASYVMRGQRQAIIAAVLATLIFPWLGAAILALVLLRRGYNEGMVVLIAALIPATIVAVQPGDIVTLPLIIVTALSAQVLRATASWRSVLMLLPVVTCLLAIALATLGEPRLAVMQQMYAEVMAAQQAQLAEGQVLPFPTQVTIEQIASGWALIVSVSVVLSLMLGRWMQAGLYNPGGFKLEFHALRFSPGEAGILLLVILLLMFTSEQWMILGLVFAVPLLFAGIALAHGYVGLRKLSGHWLGVFYLLVFFIGFFRAGVVLLAVLDSLIDFRKRAAASLQQMSENLEEKNDDSDPEDRNQ